MKTVGALVAVIGGVLGIFAYFRTVPVPDENQAQLFVENYYASAPIDPSASWAMTTSSYKDQELTGGFENYNAYWRSFRRASVNDFGLSKDPQRQGWWKAEVTYVPYVGGITRPYFQYELKCDWQSVLPWEGCVEDNISLNKVRQYRPRDFDR